MKRAVFLGAAFWLVFSLISPAGVLSETHLNGPRKISVTGEKGKWQLRVDGEPFYIQGIGCGDYLTAEMIDETLALARETGANTLRRWGESDYDDLILQKAGDYELMIMMGYWLPIDLDYVNDATGKEILLDNISEFVREHKESPNLLLWGIGNETIVLGELEMKKNKVKISIEDREARRVAFAKFLEKACRRIKEEDPNHPIVYAGAGFTALKYIKDHTPSLDVYGVNFYGGAPIAHSTWRSAEINIPYIFTEYGPLGPWEVNKDENDMPVEPSEEEKSEAFRKVWRDFIKKNEGYNLGGFAFHLGEKITGIEGMSPTWWGLLYEGYKKRSFWMVRYIYTGRRPEKYPPVIREFSLSKKRQLSPGDTLGIRVNVSDRDVNSLRGEIRFYDVSQNQFVKTLAISSLSERLFRTTVPHRGGTYRVYFFVKDAEGNLTSANQSVSVGQ